MKNNVIMDKAFNFALLVIDLYRFLTETKKEYVMSKQLLKSGTSIGANVEEAQAAQSKKDFISKMSIASKESRESYYWLRLLKEAEFLNDYKKNDLIFSENKSIINILSKIVKTSSVNEDTRNNL